MSRCTGTGCEGCEQARREVAGQSTPEKKLRVVFEMETTIGMEEGDDNTSPHQIRVFHVGFAGATEPFGQILTTDVVAKWLTDNFGMEQK